MNIYSCRECGGIVLRPQCQDCGSHNVGVLGPLHLGVLGIDVYVSIVEMPTGPQLLIQKPSGQVWTGLNEEDMLE